MKDNVAVTAQNLLALVWLCRDRALRRAWYSWRTLCGATHVTLYSDPHSRTDFYWASVTGSKAGGWVSYICMLTWNGETLAETFTTADLGMCGSAAAAKKLVLGDLEKRLATLEASLLAETEMSPASVRVLEAMCSNNVRLAGVELLVAADVARAAVR
jgi:hypothetical protein